MHAAAVRERVMPQRVMPAEQGIVLDSLSAGYGQTLIVNDINLTIPHAK
ncbi:Uncharacterised protein [Raoultella terrigena]|uniref:Uncharacterized protein n=1 Tax=Raoultella terrigena TaxID=577 RepID=A0A485BR40_RAOTE|nr:Uncharacterised protein [Raoultella terrigena]